MPERFFISAPATEKTERNDEPNGPIPECFKDEFRMLNNVKFTLCTNTDIVQSLPTFVQALDTFEGYVNKISGMYKDTRARLIKFTCRLATAVSTYGVMTENNELISESSVDEDNLENQSDHILLFKSSRILEHARKYLQAPNPFGIYHEIFVECEDAMDNFGYAAEGPGSTLIEKNNWKKEHDRLFINAHEFLQGTLDRLVDSIKAKYPRFYREYQKSKILDKPVMPPEPGKTGEGSFGVPF
ncbi:MAG: hypothetical protein ACM3UR_10210 [Bacteroidota bacterium]|nr:hypothetical protein [Ignavibacteria bacterium]MCU7518953.1 hypothetical protein [Ignavibacteria bacterium]MCU7525812.1 hypothetical protein [Ignavibacteria bacterium]